MDTAETTSSPVSGRRSMSQLIARAGEFTFQARFEEI
jgi:hypothetical protein